MAIDIQTRNLPSRGWKSGLPESFQMEKFSGRHTRQLARAAKDKDWSDVLQRVLPDCLSIPIDALTIPDAFSLIFNQRMLMNEVSPVVLSWQCKKPVYEYGQQVMFALQGDTTPTNIYPCEHSNVSVVDKDSCAMAILNASSDEFDLPRMRNYDHTTDEQDGMFYWFVAHMGPNFDANLARLEQQQDLELWTRLSDWVQASRHGIITELNMTCNHCARESLRSWDFQPSVFINA